MEIVTLWQPQHSDGYRNYSENIYFMSSHEANDYAKSKHGAYSSSPEKVKAICDKGSYYILKQEAPVYLYNSDLHKEKRKQEILDRLSPEERELLGV